MFHHLNKIIRNVGCFTVYTDVTVLQFLTDAPRLLDFLATNNRGESFIELTSTNNVYCVFLIPPRIFRVDHASIYLSNNFP